jgi:thymidylate kinase
MLIAVEGIDGAGKTTLVRGLARHFEASGRPVLSLRRFMIPEITELWWRLVEAHEVDQRATATLAAADYRLGLTRCIGPALDENRIVLADKYVYSHLVFFALRGVERHGLDALFARALVPDHVLYVSLPASLALDRLRATDGKPDLLEAGLDHRLGLTIGVAFERYGLGGAPADLRESHFLEQQARAEELFGEVLPREVTHVVDGDRTREELLAACVEHVDG